MNGVGQGINISGVSQSDHMNNGNQSVLIYSANHSARWQREVQEWGEVSMSGTRSSGC